MLLDYLKEMYLFVIVSKRYQMKYYWTIFAVVVVVLPWEIINW